MRVHTWGGVAHGEVLRRVGSELSQDGLCPNGHVKQSSAVVERVGAGSPSTVGGDHGRDEYGGERRIARATDVTLYEQEVTKKKRVVGSTAFEPGMRGSRRSATSTLVQWHIRHLNEVVVTDKRIIFANAGGHVLEVCIDPKMAAGAKNVLQAPPASRSA